MLFVIVGALMGAHGMYVCIEREEKKETSLSPLGTTTTTQENVGQAYS